MKIPNVKVLEKAGKFLRTGWTLLEHNKPAVMTGAAMGGAVLLTAESAKAGAKTSDILKEIGEADTVDKIKAVAPLWVETACTLIFVEIMVFGANRENMKRLAALASAYSLSESALKDYKEKAEEIVGKKKVSEIQQAVDTELARRNPVEASDIVDTGMGKTRYKLADTNLEFYSDRAFLERKINDLNREMDRTRDGQVRNEVYFTTFNDVLRAWKLEGVKWGEEMGWNNVNGGIEAKFNPIYMENGVDIIHVIRFNDMTPTFED